MTEKAEANLSDKILQKFECSVCKQVMTGKVYRCPYDGAIVCETCLGGSLVQKDIAKKANI